MQIRYLKANYQVEDVDVELLSDTKPIVPTGNCLEHLDNKVYWGWRDRISER
jgi:hypothetical protein